MNAFGNSGSYLSISLEVNDKLELVTLKYGEEFSGSLEFSASILSLVSHSSKSISGGFTIKGTSRLDGSWN